MPAAALGLIAAALLGWGDEISILPTRGDRLHSDWQLSVAELDRPSERTRETLRRFDVEDRYRRDPEGAFATLEHYVRRGPEAELVYALAELSWIEGRRAEHRRRGGAQALDHYTDTVAYAFDYLFDPDLAQSRSTTDPRHLLACSLYNAALDRLLHAASTREGLKPGSEVRLVIHGSEQVMKLNLQAQTPWKAGDIEELLLASDFEVDGLDSRNHRFGLGVPLIAVKRTDHKKAEGVERFYPTEMAFPLTAVLRPNSSLHDAGNVKVEAIRDCTIDLVDPVQLRTIGQGAETLSIEADLTTPLAYMWSRTDLNTYRWTGLFRPGQATDRAGLMLIRPYEPGKIPVVMVHGLMSSPLAWIPMINELLREPEIQRHYQFMLYLYPTGMPVPIAASGLRDSLEEARMLFNPRDTDPAFGKMVLLGHSMGGLLSHAMVVDDNELFWQMFTYKSFNDILGPPELLREIDHYIHFQPLSYVRRVVFLATPHRGSDYTRRLVGRVGTSLISEPDDYTKLIDRLVKDNPDTFPRRIRHLPTSIDTLDPDSPVLLALLKMPINPGVALHSIIGSIRPEARTSTTDGVVAYASAHLDGVESEVVVHSGHDVQKDPLAIREVKRILLKHLAGQTPLLNAPEKPPAAQGVEIGPVSNVPGPNGMPRPRR